MMQSLLKSLKYDRGQDRVHIPAYFQRETSFIKLAFLDGANPIWDAMQSKTKLVIINFTKVLEEMQKRIPNDNFPKLFE